LSSNRTIVGLKRNSDYRKVVPPNEQQSHHCGIETHHVSNNDFPNLKQQSHHCGIETSTTLIAALFVWSAAIAPLWD